MHSSPWNFCLKRVWDRRKLFGCSVETETVPSRWRASLAREEIDVRSECAPMGFRFLTVSAVVPAFLFMALFLSGCSKRADVEDAAKPRDAATAVEPAEAAPRDASASLSMNADKLTDETSLDPASMSREEQQKRHDELRARISEVGARMTKLQRELTQAQQNTPDNELSERRVAIAALRQEAIQMVRDRVILARALDGSQNAKPETEAVLTQENEAVLP